MADEGKRRDNDSQGPSIPPLELGDLSVTPPHAHEPESAATFDTAVTAPETQAEQGASTSKEKEGQGSQSGSLQNTDGTAESAAAELARPSTDAGPGPLPELDTNHPPIDRQMSEAIGAATELPTPMLAVGPELVTEPILQFTLLLASTGTRHPFQLNERYLTKRNVNAVDTDGKFDPSTISVYNLKELILKDWRDDWDAKPSSPSAIRLIFFGQLLSDNVSLKECKLQTGGAANVLHITVKPQEAIDEEEAGKGGRYSMSRDRDGHGRSSGCRCVIL